MRGPWEPLWHVGKQRASCGPHCPRSNYMESGVLLMAVLVSRENLQDEEGALTMSVRWRGFIRERQGERSCVAEEEREWSEERKRNGFFVAKKERETRFDVLLWSLRARRQGGRQSRSYSDITLASLRSYYCHATAVKRTEHLLASLTCKENFSSDEDTTFDNETPFVCWNLEVYCISKFRK